MRYLNTKKRAGIVLMSVLLVGSLAGCDSDDDTAVAATDGGVEAEAVVDTDPAAEADASTGTQDDLQVAHEEMAVGGPPESGGDDHLATQLAELPVETLTEQEATDIAYMREEEKLARDVYLTLAELWDVNVFANISRAEQMHMDNVLALIDRYDLEDPAATNDVGVFTNPDLQALYDSLIEQGSVSLEDALLVGAAIEDIDIFDLQVAIAATDNEDVALVWDNLLTGSYNHMRAFTRQLDRNGVEFTPSYISVAEYEAIIG